MAAVYFAALTYVIGFAPQGSPEDTIRIVTECLDFDAPPSLFFVCMTGHPPPTVSSAMNAPVVEQQGPQQVRGRACERVRFCERLMKRDLHTRSLAS